ncbi:MAG: penicillin-insensitive murein endopeptidase, partial [Gemmatimonadales bacterium]
STSIGRPQRGRLRSSEQLRSGPGYRVRTPSRAYGTNEAVEFINRVFGRVHQRYPEAPTLAIGDLSYRRGGRMRPHISHQSGRDADIAYYTVGRESDDGFVVATPENLDVPLTWYLLKSFIDTEAVQYVFVDYELQAVLYEYVERRGATREELERWFQYPRENTTAGLLRHSRGHDDHFHIRFRCPRSDERCRD